MLEGARRRASAPSVPTEGHHAPRASLYAIAHDQTGCFVRRYVPNTWLLHTEVSRAEIPQDLLLSINQSGYCLLDEYEICSTRLQWLSLH